MNEIKPLQTMRISDRRKEAMMKKYIEENKKKVMIIAGVILVLIIALIIGLVSCGNEKSKALESKKDVAAVEEKADKDAEEEDKDKDKKDEKKDEKDSKKDDSDKADKKQDKDSSKSKSASAKSPAASSGSQVSKPAASSGGSSSSASSSSGSTVKKPSSSSGSSSSSGGSTTTDKPKEKVWVVDKQAWTEQVPEYGYGYQIYVNGSLVFETADPAAYEAKMDYYANQGIPTTQKMGQIVVGYKTINHPEQGHWEYR